MNYDKSATQPLTLINGYIFIMIGREDYLIPDLEFIEILEDLIKKNYVLIYIKRYPSDDIDKTVITIKKSIQFLDEVFKCDKESVYFMGRESTGICEMMLLYNNYKKIKGMIWICISSVNRVKKDYKKILKKGLSIDFKEIENKICIISIYKKHSMDKLNTWLS